MKKLAGMFLGLAALTASADFTYQKNGQEVWRLRTDGTKPYFEPLCTVGGPSLVWASPPDHPWHYGLWFSWKYINKVNYWEEDKVTRQPAGKTILEKQEGTVEADGRADIRLELAYGDVLKEKRRIEISAPDAEGGYSMDWTQEFTAVKEAVLDCTPVAKAGWGGYAGLSVRLSRELKEVKAVTADSVVDMAAGRMRPVSVAAENNGILGGAEYGITVVPHPSNPRFPSNWYLVNTPKEPFYFFNDAILTKEPYTLKAGEKLVLRYRVYVHKGRWTPERLKTESVRFGAVK